MKGYNRADDVMMEYWLYSVEYKKAEISVMLHSLDAQSTKLM